MKRVLWKPEEDRKLLELMQTLGNKWTLIGTLIGNRSGKQVRERYANHLRTGLNKSVNWTMEEDQQFVSLYNRFGNQWCKIAKFLPERSECQIKNRFHTYIKDVIATGILNQENYLDSKENKEEIDFRKMEECSGDNEDLYKQEQIYKEEEKEIEIESGKDDGQTQSYLSLLHDFFIDEKMFMEGLPSLDEVPNSNPSLLKDFSEFENKVEFDKNVKNDERNSFDDFSAFWFPEPNSNIKPCL